MLLVRKLSRSPTVIRHTQASGSSDTFSESTTRRRHRLRQQKSAPTENNQSPPPSLHVRIVPNIDNPSQSFIFDIIDIELCIGTVVRMGRFAERTQSPFCLSFRSKVVSRLHCELWMGTNGKLYLRDTRSSTGTFLNHVRLSPSGEESLPVVIEDGDIVQLGVNFQEDQEIYRCVKMRFELDRSHRPRPLSFCISQMRNLQALSHITNHGSPSNGQRSPPLVVLSDPPPETQQSGKAFPDTQVSSGSGSLWEVDECCICLYPMAPFQALFLAPCSHTFHFKCIHALMTSFPGFQCPVCRAYADLEASVAIEPEEVLEKYGLRCKSLNPVVTTSEPPESLHAETEDKMNAPHTATKSFMYNSPITSKACTTNPENLPESPIRIASTSGFDQEVEFLSVRDQNQHPTNVHNVDNAHGSLCNSPSQRPSNLIVKLKSALFDKHKSNAVDQQPVRRSTMARSLSSLGFMAQQTNREDPVPNNHPKAVSSSVQRKQGDGGIGGSSICSSSATGAGIRILGRSRSHHTPSRLRERLDDS